MTGHRRGSRRLALAIALVALLAASTRPAAAAPAWVDELEAKGKRYQERLQAALDRLEAAATQAGDRLSEVVKQRLAELEELLGDTADAATAVLEERGAAYAAIVHARLAQATAVAEQLEREVGEIVAGTRQQLSLDRRRLVTGTRAIVADTLAEAGVILRDARVVDDRVLARAATQAEAEARRWLWIVLAGGGVIVAALGVGLLWPRRRKGDAAARRPLVTAAGALVVAAGLGGAVYGVVRWRQAPAGTTVALGESRCDALVGAETLVQAGRATAAARDQAIAQLARCRLVAASDTSAELIADRLHKLHALSVH